MRITDPLPYQDMISLLIGSKKVITDSGDLQKEAYFSGAPALVMMPDTAWIELVEAGWNVLVDADREKNTEGTWPHDPLMSLENQNLYGDGHSGQRIAQILSRGELSA